jgi:hypothetical protein
MFFSFKKLIFVLGLLSDCVAVSSQDNLRALYDEQTTLLEKQNDKIQQQESRLTEQATRLAALETAFQSLNDDQEEEDDTPLDDVARYSPLRALQKNKNKNKNKKQNNKIKKGGKDKDKAKAKEKDTEKKIDYKDRNICYTQESDDEIDVYVECEVGDTDDGILEECNDDRRLLSGDAASVALGDWKERRELGQCKKANKEIEIIPFGRYNVGELGIRKG